MQADVAALSARVEAQAADERAERIRMRSMLSEFAADDEDDAEYEDDATLAAAPHIVVKLAEPAGQAEDAATGDAASEALAERRAPQVVQSGFDEAVELSASESGGSDDDDAPEGVSMGSLSVIGMLWAYPRGLVTRFLTFLAITIVYGATALVLLLMPRHSAEPDPDSGKITDVGVTWRYVLISTASFFCLVALGAIAALDLTAVDQAPKVTEHEPVEAYRLKT